MQTLSFCSAIVADLVMVWLGRVTTTTGAESKVDALLTVFTSPPGTVFTLLLGAYRISPS